MDDTQLDYFLALVGGSRSSLQAAQRAAQQQQQQAQSGHVAGSSSSSGAAGSGSGSGPGPAPGMLAALLGQVKEIMPDYGDGFLTACLAAYNYNAEQVGGGGGGCLALSTSLPAHPPRPPTSSPARPPARPPAFPPTRPPAYLPARPPACHPPTRLP